MAEVKNLVKEFLLEKKVIDPNNFLYDYFYEGTEIFAYKNANDTMLYVSYELTPDGIGYAFCVTVKTNRFEYDISPVFYSKSFSNDTTGEWKNITDNFKDKLLCDAMRDLNIYGKPI